MKIFIAFGFSQNPQDTNNQKGNSSKGCYPFHSSKFCQILTQIRGWNPLDLRPLRSNRWIFLLPGNEVFHPRFFISIQKRSSGYTSRMSDVADERKVFAGKKMPVKLCLQGGVFLIYVFFGRVHGGSTLWHETCWRSQVSHSEPRSKKNGRILSIKYWLFNRDLVGGFNPSEKN